MNILPKKRWHVRTKENIARVRRDEAQAAKEQKELERRIQLANQEARIAFLRANHQKIDKESDEEESSTLEENKHVNFFTEIEQAGGYFGGYSKELAAEKKAEQDKFEQKIGLLTYLGQDIPSEDDWYVKSPGERIQDNKNEEKTNKRKQLEDPLYKMNKYLKKKKVIEEDNKSDKNDYLTTKFERAGSSKDESKSKIHVYKKEEKRKKSIEELRAERLEREREEKLRAEQLIRKHKGLDVKPQDEPVDERLRKYNTQFNPHLARQSRTDR